MEPVVHFRAAVSLLGRFPALAGVDLDVQRGSITLVHGPNGAGKTTLLRTCAGLVPVVDGEAVALGFDLRDRTGRVAVRRHVGLPGHAAARDVIDDLMRTAAASGATIVIASHELDRATTLATAVVRLAGGTVQRDARQEVAAGVP